MCRHTAFLSKVARLSRVSSPAAMKHSAPGPMVTLTVEASLA